MIKKEKRCIKTLSLLIKKKTQNCIAWWALNSLKSNGSSEFHFPRRKMNIQMENSDSKPRGKREGERAKDFGKKKESDRVESI